MRATKTLLQAAPHTSFFNCWNNWSVYFSSLWRKEITGRGRQHFGGSQSAVTKGVTWDLLASFCALIVWRCIVWLQSSLAELIHCALFICYNPDTKPRSILHLELFGNKATLQMLSLVGFSRAQIGCAGKPQSPPVGGSPLHREQINVQIAEGWREKGQRRSLTDLGSKVAGFAVVCTDMKHPLLWRGTQVGSPELPNPGVL